MTNVIDQEGARPPVPARHPVVRSAHGDDRIDDYAWLRNRDDPAVIAHLEAENAWTETALAHVAPSASVSTRRWWAASRRRTSAHRSRMVRTSTTRERRQAVSTRCTAGARTVATSRSSSTRMRWPASSGYFHLGDAEVSPDHAILAYSVDFTGAERYTLRLRSLDTGVDLPDVLEGVSYSLAWSSDSAYVFYTRPDAAMRPWQIWRHQVGAANDTDVLVLQEDDERYFASVARTRSGAFILISLNSQMTSEVHLLRADEPTAAPSVIEPRRQGIEYAVDHHDRPIVHRHQRRSAQLPARHGTGCHARLASTGSNSSRIGTDVKLEGVDLFARHAVLFERVDGLRGSPSCG